MDAKTIAKHFGLPRAQDRLALRLMCCDRVESRLHCRPLACR